MRKLLALVSIFFLSFSSLGFAQTRETTTLSVYVKTAAGDMIQGINISLAGEGYNQAKNTDVQGKAVFEITAAGEYTSTINLSADSSYQLVDGEEAQKTVAVTIDKESTLYYGVKVKEVVEEPEEEDTKLKVNLPDIFYKDASTTTNIDGKTASELTNLNNFTLHIPNYSKIVFSKAVSFNSEEAVDRLNKLDSYVFMQKLAEVSISTDLMPELDKPATVTLYNLNYVSLGSDYVPVVLKDGNDPGSSVSDITLTGSDTISFIVDGFSSYFLKPTLKFEETEITTEDETFLLQGMIDDLDSKLSFFVNDTKYEKNVTIKNDGTFEVEFELEEKDNTIEVIATGIASQRTSQEIDVTYEKGQGKEEVDNTMLYGVIGLVILATAGGAIYYYKKYYLPKKLKKNSLKKDVKTDQFDTRLMTEEEKKAYLSDTNAQEDRPQQEDKT